MAKLLKLRRGTTTQHGSFTGAEGEVTIDTDKDTAVVHDGSTTGGRALAREDLNNVSSSTIAGRLSNDSIAPSKIGAGTLPSDVTVASANLVDGTIVNADVNASAAIAQSKLNIANATTSAAGYQSAADKTKLDGIESGATADQTAAEIRTLIGSASDSNVFTDADHSKLNAIEAGATADQTASEIKTLYESNSNTNEFSDAEQTKLSGIATSANNYSHPNHSGEVTSSGDGAMTIADNVVDEANLKVSNSPTNGYFLQAQSGNTGGLTWAQVAQPDLTNLSASNLTSGTVPDARFPSTLPALNGSNLTNLAASALSGALPALDGSNLTNLASACTRVKIGVRTDEYDLPHYNQGYQLIPGTACQFDNVSADNVYLIYHAYQLRSTSAPSHSRHSRTVNAYISGPSHNGQGHYAVYTAGSWESYGPFISINESRNTSDKDFGIYGRCTYYTDSYNSIRNVYLMVMEFKIS